MFQGTLIKAKKRMEVLWAAIILNGYVHPRYDKMSVIKIPILQVSRTILRGQTIFLPNVPTSNETGSKTLLLTVMS